MESLYQDPLTQQPYDLTIHLPYILPCCGETCAITTIHDAKSATNLCPFCGATLPDAGWIVNKAICQMLSAQAEPQSYLQSNENVPSIRHKIPCSIHRNQSASLYCINDNTMLCTKCLSRTSRHVGHQVEDLSQHLQLLMTKLAEVKPKMASLRDHCEQALAKLYNDAKTLLQTKLDEQVAESERVLKQLSLLQAPGHSSSMLDIKDIHTLCQKVQEMDVEGKVAGLEKEMRTVMEGWLEEYLPCIKVRESGKMNKIKGECLKTIQDTSAVRCLEMLPSSQLVSASEDTIIKVWDTASATCVKTLRGHTDYVLCLKNLSLNHIASSSGDTTIKIWNTTAATCIKTLYGHTDCIFCLQVLPSGLLVSGSEDTTIKVWDTTSATCVKTLRGHTNTVFCLQVLPSGQLASGSNDRTIKIWNVDAANCLQTLRSHTEAVLSLKILPLGYLASASADGTIKIWNAAITACLKTLRAHTSSVWDLHVLHSGQLVSGSADKSIKIWDIVAGTCLKTLKDHTSYVCCLQELPSGQLVSGSQDHMIKIWE